MKNFLHLPSVADVLVDGGVEVFCLIDTLSGTDVACLNVVTYEYFEWHPMSFIHGEHEKRQHDSDHDERRHTRADGVLCQKEHRHTHESAQAETNDLALCKVENEFGLDARQVLGNRNVCHELTSHSAALTLTPCKLIRLLILRNANRQLFAGLMPAALTLGLALAKVTPPFAFACVMHCVLLHGDQ